MRRLLTVAAAVGTALVATCAAMAAPASAAVISANKACFVNTDSFKGAPVTVTGSGFNAGDQVEITGTGVFASTTAGSTGAFAVTTAGPILTIAGPGWGSFTLTATDQTTGITTTTKIKVANLAVAPKPLDVKHVSKDKVTFDFSGFTPGKLIYGYYLRKKVVAKAKFGKAKGACGLLSQKALLYPGGHPRDKQYKVVFEQAKRYTKRATPQFSGTLSIFTL
jgi:hypothetical protein